MIRFVHLFFQAGHIRFRGRQIRFQFLAVQLGNQIAFLHCASLIHSQIDNASGNLRTDNHLVAVHHSDQRDVRAVRRGKVIRHRRNHKNYQQERCKLSAGHRALAFVRLSP